MIKELGLRIMDSRLRIPSILNLYLTVDRHNLESIIKKK